MNRTITDEMLQDYENYLYEQEKSRATIQKYLCDLQKLVLFADNRELTKSLVIEYKEYLIGKGYKTTSINSYLVAANGFFTFVEWFELRINTLKVQREAFMPQERELSKEEYKKLVETAYTQGKTKIGMVVETICGTGIRVSELSAVTVEAVKKGMATIANKGKERTILIPRKLQVKLLTYIKGRMEFPAVRFSVQLMGRRLTGHGSGER